jgi:hypothetical protein
MAERILFEFRTKRDEDGYRFEFRPGEGELMVCGPFSWAGWGCRPSTSGWADRAWERSRRTMRETLDAFERMYEDLYGGEEQE